MSATRWSAWMGVIAVPILAALHMEPAEADELAPVSITADDPSTYINESALLDTSRFVVDGDLDAPTTKELARAHADQRGMTSCGQVMDAELDDVILALPNGPDGLPYMNVVYVTELDFDQALASADHNRTNIIACDSLED